MTVHVSPSQLGSFYIRGNFSLIKSRWAKLFLRQRLQKVKRGALKWNGLASKFKSLQSFSNFGVFIDNSKQKSATKSYEQCLQVYACNSYTWKQTRN